MDTSSPPWRVQGNLWLILCSFVDMWTSKLVLSFHWKVLDLYFHELFVYEINVFETPHYAGVVRIPNLSPRVVNRIHY